MKIVCPVCGSEIKGGTICDYCGEDLTKYWAGATDADTGSVEPKERKGEETELKRR